LFSPIARPMNCRVIVVSCRCIGGLQGEEVVRTALTRGVRVLETPAQQAVRRLPAHEVDLLGICGMQRDCVGNLAQQLQFCLRVTQRG
jgi:hypothetical protein